MHQKLLAKVAKLEERARAATKLPEPTVDLSHLSFEELAKVILGDEFEGGPPDVENQPNESS